MLGRHVCVMVSPQPYDLIQEPIYPSVPLQSENNLLPYTQNLNHSYKMLQGRFTTHAHDLVVWYFARMTPVFHSHESPYSSYDRGPRVESCTLLKHLSISFLSKVIKGYLIFPEDFLTRPCAQAIKIIRQYKNSIMVCLYIGILYMIEFDSLS